MISKIKCSFCRLVQALKESPMRSNQLYQGTSKITMAHDAIQAIKQLRRDVVEAMRSLMKLAKEKQTSGMLPICEDMITKTRILLSLWDPGLVEEALTFLEEYKVAKVQEDSTSTSEDILTLDFKANQSLSPFKRITQQLNFDLKSPDFDDFVTPDTPECVQDIWSKSGIKNGEYASLSYSRNDMPNSNTGKNDDAEENFVIFPEVEDDLKQTEVGVNDNKIQQNHNEKKENYEDEKEDLKNDSDPCKRFLDTQKMCNSPSANYYKPTDEPEPWDLTQLNIEASVMCLVSKVKFLCGRCSSPAVRLRNKSSLGRTQSLKSGCLPSNRHNAEVVTIQPKNGIKCEESNKLLDELNERQQSSPGLEGGLEKPAYSKAKEGKKIVSINAFSKNVVKSYKRVCDALSGITDIYCNSSSNEVCQAVDSMTRVIKSNSGQRNKFTEGLDFASIVDWTCELRPSMKKLRQAMDGLLKTARLTHSVFRVQEDSKTAQRACNVRYRRDVCFSQAVSGSFLYYKVRTLN